MRRQNVDLSRRSATIAGIVALLGLGRQAMPAQPAGGDMPQGGTGAAPKGAESLAGKTVLVTGSTDGLGRMLAAQLAELGALVIVHGRNRERGEEVVRDIRDEGGSAVFYRADLASLQEVRTLADTVLEKHERLDILINNAGLGSPESRQTSRDGHELVFAVNYLAGFLLTHRLLPLLKRSAPARIVNVSSIGQSPIDFDDVMLAQEFSGTRAYTQSKLAQVMFTFDLARELQGQRVTVNALHPATYMDTTMVRQAGVAPRSTVAEGAAAVMQLAVAPQLEGRTGRYFNGLQEARANDQAYDEEARAKLSALSRELTGVG